MNANEIRAFNSMIIEVLIPVGDVKSVIEFAKDLDISILDMEPINETYTAFELLISNSFCLYALGKRVAYSEFLKDLK